MIFSPMSLTTIKKWKSNGLSIFWNKFSNKHPTSLAISENQLAFSTVFVQAVLRTNFCSIKKNFFLRLFKTYGCISVLGEGKNKFIFSSIVSHIHNAHFDKLETRYLWTKNWKNIRVGTLDNHGFIIILILFSWSCNWIHEYWWHFNNNDIEIHALVNQKIQ